MKRAAFVNVLWLFVASAAWAETLYVTDQVTAALRADITPNAAVLATISTGAALEVLDRDGTLVRVRDANGDVGWVDASALTTQPPAAVQLKATRADLDRTRAQLANAQAQLEKARATPTPDNEKQAAELASTRAQLGKIQSEIKKKDEEIAAVTAARDAAVSARDAAVKEAGDLRGAVARQAAQEKTAPAAPEVVQVSDSKAESGFSFVWLGVAFAMLVAGFVAGVVWVKESIRRRMGGMYLRI